MAVMLGIDTGGTYTDAVLIKNDNEIIKISGNKNIT
jgi:N-methylhydantoinase A/oxoprolinase/acetone carboxylase beta subunit